MQNKEKKIFDNKDNKEKKPINLAGRAANWLSKEWKKSAILAGATAISLSSLANTKDINKEADNMFSKVNNIESKADTTKPKSSFKVVKINGKNVLFKNDDSEDSKTENKKSGNVNSGKSKKNINKKDNHIDGGPEYTGPKIDNFEYYSAEDAYKIHNADSTLAMKNYRKGLDFFSYHTVSDQFKGINSSFWRKRNIELGRDINDTRTPLKPGEHIESLKTDHLVVSKFSIKDGLEYSRLIIIKKGTSVIVDSTGRIVATEECANDWVVSKTICPPGTNIGSTYNDK